LFTLGGERLELSPAKKDEEDLESENKLKPVIAIKQKSAKITDFVREVGKMIKTTRGKGRKKIAEAICNREVVSIKGIRKGEWIAKFKDGFSAHFRIKGIETW